MGLASSSMVPRAPVGDEVLVERALMGDITGFEKLYARHVRYVAATVFRVLGDDRDLDDVVQESFILAAQYLPQLHDRARFRRWLVRIAIREAGRALSRRKSRGAMWWQFARGAATVSDPEDLTPAAELYRALDRVPEKLRLPWTLHRVAGLSLIETAEACGVSLATVKRRIAGAQRRLERRLAVE